MRGEFSILDFNFSPEFNKAIEDKQVAEQRAIEKWNAVLPEVSAGDAVPFLDLGRPGR